MTVAPATARNPGPTWGFAFIVAADRHLPGCLFAALRRLGAAIAVLLMPERRRSSRSYLTAVLKRPATLRDVIRHFTAFTDAMVLKLQVAHGRPHRADWAENAGEFRAVLERREQALLGSLHLGHSDITGFLLATELHQPIVMVRERRENSGDIDPMLARAEGGVSVIWVNHRENLLYALKDALLSGQTVAMKCDRAEYSAKSAAFTFLGSRHRFPTTIYHLGIIFNLPVLHAFSVPGGPGESVVHCSPAWRPDPALDRSRNLELAEQHFQRFLLQVETTLRQHPYQWFNFTPLHPVAPS